MSRRETPTATRRRFLRSTASLGMVSALGFQGSGVVSASGGDIEWSFEADSAVWSSPAIVDGTVYISGGVEHGRVYAFDRTDGSVEWTFQTEELIWSSPTVVDGTVFVGGHDHMVYALDAATGTEQWRFDAGDRVFLSPTVVDGTVFAGSWDDHLYAIDASDGSERWTFDVGGKVFSAPAVVDGMVYIGNIDTSRLYALAASTGAEQWQFEAAGPMQPTPTVVDGTVFASSHSGNLYALDSTDGSEQWRFEADNNIQSPPTVADGTVFVGSHDDSVYAVDATDGTEIWAFETNGDVDSGPTVAGGTVFVGSFDGNVYALDASNGSEQWRFETGGRVFSSPIVSEGTLFFGSEDNSIYALDAGIEVSSVDSRAALGSVGHHDDWRYADQTIAAGGVIGSTVAAVRQRPTAVMLLGGGVAAAGAAKYAAGREVDWDRSRLDGLRKWMTATGSTVGTDMMAPGETRLETAVRLANQAAADPHAVRNEMPKLRELLADDNEGVRNKAANALAALAKVDPAAIQPAVEDLKSATTDEYSGVRTNAERALSRILTTYPDDILRLAELASTFPIKHYPEDVRTRIERLRTVQSKINGFEPVPEREYAGIRTDAAAALRWIADEHPEDARNTVDALTALLDTQHDDERVRNKAAEALAELAKVYPGAVRPAVEDLRAATTDEHSGVRSTAERALSRIGITYPDDILLLTELVVTFPAEKYPEDIRATIETLRAVESKIDRSKPISEPEYADIRADAAAALRWIADEHPEDAREAVDALTALVDTSQDDVRADAAAALAALAATYPTILRESVEAIVPLLSDRVDDVRTHAIESLLHVSDSHPRAVRETVEALEPFLEADAADRRADTAHILARISKGYPENVRPIVPTLDGALADDSADVRYYAALSLARVANAYPETVRPSATILESVADNDADRISEQAAAALSAITPSYPDDIRAIADFVSGVRPEDYPDDIGPTIRQLQRCWAYIEAYKPIPEGDYAEIRRKAATVINRIADERSEAAREGVDLLENLLSTGQPDLRADAVDALATLAAAYPTELRRTVDVFVSQLSTSHHAVRYHAIQGLTHVSEAHPDAVAETVDAVEPYLDAADDRVRANAATIVARVAAEDPEAVRETVETLESLLLEDTDRVRKQTAVALREIAAADPERVLPAVETVGAALRDDVCAEIAVETLGSIAAAGDGLSVKEVVELYAPDRLDDIFDREPTATKPGATVNRPQHGSPAATSHETEGSGTIQYDALTEGSRIGSGGNAEVYLATVDGDRTVALKKPRIQGTLDKRKIDQLLGEAERWGKLCPHDNIVSVIDYGFKTAGYPWIAMEYLPGGDVREHAGQLEHKQALWTALGITKAVYHAHKRGVMHLDLKPANILFQPVEDGWDVPKVADWGLSKHLLDISQSVDGFSPRYAAPEQFDSTTYGAPDARTDIYQLGTVLYELFTGRPPYKGSKFEVMDRIKHGSPPNPSEIAAVPAGLDEILQTAMATRQEDRYEDVLYLRDKLRERFRTV